jgi:D-alanyl-D-alanine carboxypeptidase
VLAKVYGKPSETMATGARSTPFQIASNSKQFCAAAILLLQDEGKLSLDDKVSKYLPNVTDADKITIRQLLSHTSGLQDYWPQDYSFADMAHPVTPQQILAKWAEKPLDFQPGTQWQYSNTGYVVAGLIVEKVSGMPLLTFLKASIFKPLGITAYDQDKAIGKAFPQGYGRRALGPVRVEPPAATGWLYAAGELSMSASDVAKWDIARIDRTVLTPTDWAAQETTIKLTDGSDTHYGLGVQAGVMDGVHFVGHTGEAVGFLSWNFVYPDQKDAVVVLTNSWSGDAFSAIGKGIAQVILPPANATAAAPDADTAATAKTIALFDGLRTGKLDRAQLTANANYYFTQSAIGDYRDSLGPLGEPQSIKMTGTSQLRGGFVIRGFEVTYPNRKLTISTFLEPGPNGRFEQYLVNPEK